MKTRPKPTSRRVPPPKVPPAPPARRPVPRGRLAAVAVLALLALGVALWTWRQYARPGAADLQRGLDAAAAQQLTEAEQDWLAGTRADPGFAPCFVQLGDLYMQQRRFPEAAVYYNAAAKLTPDDGTLFLKLNRADLATHDVPAARAAAKRAADLRPDDPDAQGLYGTLESQYDNRPAALTALRRAHQLRPDDRDYLVSLIQLEMAMQRIADARRDLTPWFTAHPSDPWTDHLMAVIYEQSPHTPATLQSAIALEEQARAAFPQDMRIPITLGELYLDAGRPADALKTYQAGLRLDKNSEEMLHGIVTADTRLGQPNQAAQVAARLQVETTRHQQITRLGDLMNLRPHDVGVALQKARLQEQDGNFQGAGDTYEQVLRRNPRASQARQALAAFYVRMGHPDLARRARQPDYMPGSI